MSNDSTIKSKRHVTFVMCLFVTFNTTKKVYFYIESKMKIEEVNIGYQPKSYLGINTEGE